MRLRARTTRTTSDRTTILPYLFPFLLLFSLPAGCDDTDDPGGDGGTGTDAAPTDGAGSDAPPATGNCPTLTTTTTLAESIDADATWRGAVKVTGAVRVNMAKITIEAGTTFVMDPDASIEFGWNSNLASVFARGTAAAPIRFCGKVAQAGYYKGILVGDRVTSDSVFEHVIVSDGGQMTGAALTIGAGILVKDVQVIRSGADGVQADNFKEGSERLTVMGASKIALVLTAQEAISRVPLLGSYATGNGTNAIALRFEAIDAVDATFRAAGVPYIQEQPMYVRNGKKLVFQAGVDYRLAVDQKLEVGWNGGASTITAEGTADKPILFGRVSDSAGAFAGLLLQTMVRSDSVLKFVKIKGGGNGAPALDIRAPVKIDNVTLEGNATGLSVEGKGFTAGSTKLTITGTSGGPPATVDPDAALTLPKGGAFTGNPGGDWIVIPEGALESSGTLPNLGVPYRVAGKITTRASSAQSNPALTIEAGTTLQMASDAWIEVGWNSAMASITAVGTAANPIVFRGVNDVAGSWDGILIGAMVSSSSKLDHVQILNGGKAGSAALRLNRAAFDVKNTRLSKSSGWCIERVAGDATDYATGGNTFDMCAAGNVGP